MNWTRCNTLDPNLVYILCVHLEDRTGRIYFNLRNRMVNRATSCVISTGVDG